MSISVLTTTLGEEIALSQNCVGANGFIQKVNNKEVIKRYHTDKYPPSDLLLELAILRKCKHQNIISLTSLYVDKSSLELALGLEMAHCNLKELMVYENLSYSRKINITYQILCGVGYLHSRGVIHCDIKPENVLFVDGIAKLCDFGLSVFREDENHICTTDICTFYYRAPEIVLCAEKAYTFAIDIWAVAITIWELFTSDPPFDGESIDSFVNHIFSWLGSPTKEDGEWILESKDFLSISMLGLLSHKERPEVRTKLGDELYSFLRPMLAYSPEKRISIYDCIKLPIFNASRELYSLEAEPGPSNSSVLLFDIGNEEFENKAVFDEIMTYKGKGKVEDLTLKYSKYLLSKFKQTSEITISNERLATHILNLAEHITSVNPLHTHNSKVKYNIMKDKEEIIEVIKQVL